MNQIVFGDCRVSMRQFIDEGRMSGQCRLAATKVRISPALIEPCILAGSRVGDVVFDPFMGSGTTAAVAVKHGRKYLGCELNEDYQALQEKRIQDAQNAAGMPGGAV